jgi:putative membrane protein
MTQPDGWQRLHPISPLVRGGRGTIGIVILLVPTLLRGGGSAGALFPLGVVALVTVLGFVSWLVTRWRIDGDDLRIETGVLRRRSLRFPLSQVQAIDVVRPGLARLFGVAELRLRMGGSTGNAARLSYVPASEVEELRARLLKVADGAPLDQASGPTEAAARLVIPTVPTGRLIGSILISDVGFYAEAVLAALIVSAVLAPRIAAAVVSGGGLAWLIGVVTVTWRRFNQEFHLTVADVPDGLRLGGGLIALTSETIRPGRVQAVRMVEPLLWRPFGWCRLQVDLAGRQRDTGEGQAQRRQLRTVLPVGNHALVDELLDRIVPDRPSAISPPPRRARLKSPLRYHMLGWGSSATCIVTTTGRLRRTTCWVPLGKAQSLRRVQGPLQRRLQLVSVHIDTAGRAVHATLRDRDVDEGDEELVRLTRLARAARRAAGVGAADLARIRGLEERRDGAG